MEQEQRCYQIDNSAKFNVRIFGRRIPALRADRYKQCNHADIMFLKFPTHRLELDYPDPTIPN
jgi:hypothetical protein